MDLVTLPGPSEPWGTVYVGQGNHIGKALRSSLADWAGK